MTYKTPRYHSNPEGFGSADVADTLRTPSDLRPALGLARLIVWLLAILILVSCGASPQPAATTPAALAFECRIVPIGETQTVRCSRPHHMTADEVEEALKEGAKKGQEIAKEGLQLEERAWVATYEQQVLENFDLEDFTNLLDDLNDIDGFVPILDEDALRQIRERAQGFGFAESVVNNRLRFQPSGASIPRCRKVWKVIACA